MRTGFWHLAPCHIIKPWYQCGKGGLRAPGSSKNANGLSRSDMKIQITDYFLTGIGGIRKTYLFKINGTIRDLPDRMGNVK